MNKECTIYDIAQKLKVSPSTVSRALNDSSLVSKVTRKKIQNTAASMGFRLNTFASSLRTQKTQTIGVIMHELRSNFMVSVLSGIEKVTNRAGYDLVIAHSSENYQKEMANVYNLFHRRVDGLIASLAFDTPNLDHYLPYRGKGIPVIFYDRVDELADYPKVIINNYQCGYEATRHLIEEGCSRIVLLTASLERNVYAQRHRGYIAALKEAQIPVKKEYVIVKDLSEQGALDAASAVLKMDPRPDGAFITHDFSAAVFMKALKRKGIRTPEDIAIVGFNNDPICMLVEPQLSTINYTGPKIGEAAANHLVNHLEGTVSLADTDTIIIKSELIIRQSSLRKGANS
ncbi:MAG TPA: LacI family DNA-binding transcriptional regulator [Chitinophagaceae bacterium]|nr:LacI family DNA-binding transcriptional regulator [Chitinophagaceae bacterium]